MFLGDRFSRLAVVAAVHIAGCAPAAGASSFIKVRYGATNAHSTGSPAGYDAGGLFAGGMVNQQTGLVSGTPTAAGTHTLDLRGVNAGDTGHKTLTLTITN